MSDWRHNSSGYWSNQGSGNSTQYPDTIDEAGLEDEEAYAETGEGYTYASSQDYQHEDDQQQGYQQGTYRQQDYQQGYNQQQDNQQYHQQQNYQDQHYYQAPDADRGDVTYTPTSHTGASMDVNYSVPPSEHNQSITNEAPTSSPPPLDQDPADEDRTQDFVQQRSDSYDRRAEFGTAPDTASIRRVVEARRRLREAEAQRARNRGSRSGGSGSGSAGGSGSGSGRTGGKGPGSKSGGRS